MLSKSYTASKYKSSRDERKFIHFFNTKTFYFLVFLKGFLPIKLLNKN